MKCDEFHLDGDVLRPADELEAQGANDAPRHGAHRPQPSHRQR